MIDVVMPQMGESIVEGTLTRWTKKVGEKIERDEPLFEISTDKVDTEIPAPSSGTLAEILVQEGQTVGINTVVGRIDETGGAAATPAAQPAAAAPAQPPAAAAPPPPAAAPPTPPPAKPDEPKTELPAQAEIEDRREPVEPVQERREPEGPLSPLVRKMARESNIDLALVKGTGAGGRITKQDMETYLAQSKGSQSPAPAAAPPAPVQAPPPPAAAPREALAPVSPSTQAKMRVEPMSTMRTKIAEHMVASKRISAHVTTVHRVDMTKIAKLRGKHKDDVQQRYGFSLTFLPFVVRAAAAALRQFPIVNASIDGSNIIYHNEINLGIAVALEN